MKLKGKEGTFGGEMKEEKVSTLNIILFFYTILCFGEEIGQFYSPFNRISGALFLLLYLINNKELWLLSERNRRFWAKLISTIILVLLSFGSPIGVISVGLVLLISMIWDKRVEFEVGIVFYIYLLSKSYIPVFYYVEQGIAGGLNFLLNSITPFEIDYSASAYGLGWIIIIICFTLRLITNSNIKWRQKIFRVALTIFCILILQVLYFWLASRFVNLPRPKGYNLDYYLYYLVKHIFPMDGHALLFPVAFFITVLVNKGVVVKHISLLANGNKLSRFKERAFIYGLILIFFSVLLVLYGNIDFTDITSYPKPKIYVYETEMDFDIVPNDEVYGSKNGLFGMIFYYFKDLGYQIQLGADWAQINPEGKDLLLLLNPHGKMESGEREKILSFIDKGGRLLLLGDHTHMFGLDNDYFDLAEELGISFNFDTAIYFKELWRGCLRSPNLSLDLMLKNPRNAPNIMQGASLTLTYPAVPLIIGEYGWSDMGDLENEPGYLGDRRYSTLERTGDLVLAAKRNYGKGQIEVFGDTSFLQNSPFSSSYPFIQMYLSQLQKSEINPWAILFPLSYLLITLGYALKETNLKKHNNRSANMFSLGMMLIFLTMAAAISDRDIHLNLSKKAKTLRAGIDCNFYPVYYHSDWERTNRGLGGLKNTLIRENVLPYVTFNLDPLHDDRIDVFFLLGPYKKISEGEAECLISFVERGGTLIVSVGYEHEEQITELSKRIGLKISNIPYSCLEGKDTDMGLRFVSAWPLVLEASENWDVICQTWDGKPLIVEKHIGDGQVLFVGDSYFFENRNLETGQLYYKNNMEFLRNVLSSIKKQKVGN